MTDRITKIKKARELNRKKFCTNISKLALSLKLQNPGNRDIEEIQSRLKLAVRNVPDYLIRKSGAYLYTYADIIKSGNIDDLINHDSVQSKIDGAVSSIDEPGDAKLAVTIINCVRTTWSKLNQKDQQQIINLIQSLLESYEIYAAADRVLGTVL